MGDELYGFLIMVTQLSFLRASPAVDLEHPGTDSLWEACWMLLILETRRPPGSINRRMQDLGLWV